MKRAAPYVLGSIVLLLVLLLGIWLGARQSGKDGFAAWLAEKGPLSATDPALSAALPEADPIAGLPPSALDALLKPDLTPQEQTEIIGQLLLDYWSTTHTLPNGTWEEVCAQLTGSNAQKLSLVPAGHPALGKQSFQPGKNGPGIRLHVVSSSGAAFQLIYDGPDKQPYTEDDLIRSFPPDLEF
jgi:hypothetical protein